MYFFLLISRVNRGVFAEHFISLLNTVKKIQLLSGYFWITPLITAVTSIIYSSVLIATYLVIEEI